MDSGDVLGHTKLQGMPSAHPRSKPWPHWKHSKAFKHGSGGTGSDFWGWELLLLFLLCWTILLCFLRGGGGMEQSAVILECWGLRLQGVLCSGWR